MEDKTKMDFSRNLKQLLDSNGMNQLDLAMKLSVSTATASDWCNGKKFPRTDKLQKIAALFNTGITDLVSPVGPTESSRTVALNQAEYQLLAAYRAADDNAKTYAFEILIHHPQD